MLSTEIQVRHPLWLPAGEIQAHWSSFTTMGGVNYWILLVEMLEWNDFSCSQSSSVNHSRLTTSLNSHNPESNKTGCLHNAACWAQGMFPAERPVKYVSEDAHPAAGASLQCDCWVIATGFHTSAILLSSAWFSVPALSQPDIVWDSWAEMVPCSEQFCWAAIAACCFPIY